MQVFYRKAFEAACRGSVPGELKDAHFESWPALEEALLWLPSDEQRCDAVYGNWLMRLVNPGGRQLLDQRQHLIGDGALAANYLAELAQNANDAAAEAGAELRVSLYGDWLLVVNNGRKVSPLNLIGLCDFFGHFSPPASKTRSIGRFGVGFKASFRIADEVFIQSWDPVGKFCFRIPITRLGREVSLPLIPVQDRVIQQLSGVGVPIDMAVTTPEHAGYCTPEGGSEPPLPVDCVESLCKGFKSGTLFCFHLCASARPEVYARVQEQENRIYELCPLFLPTLHAIQFGTCRLKLVHNRNENTAPVLPEVLAERVTVEFSKEGAKTSSTRFWRLKGCQENDKWQLALHANSDFLLRVERDADEDNMSVRDGAPYAFFPLNGVVWPLRVHLHIDLPPELSRRDWNHGDGAGSSEALAVESQIRSAAAAFAAWLEVNPDKRHADWDLAQLLERRPTADDMWSRVFFNEIERQARQKKILRNLWGDFTLGDAQSVSILPRKEVRAIWRELGKLCPELSAEHPLVEHGIFTFSPKPTCASCDIEDLFSQIVGQKDTTQATRCALLQAILSIQTHTTGTLEKLLGPLAIEFEHGGQATFRELCEQPGGAELTAEWHDCFAKCASWAKDAAWQNAAVFGQPLAQKLRQLSESCFNPTWAEVPARLGSVEAWREYGDRFWQGERNPCPTALRASVLANLRVPDGKDDWLPVQDLWLDGDASVDCFAGILKAWAVRCSEPTRRRKTDLMQQWGLYSEWEKSAKKCVADGLPGKLTQMLTENSQQDALSVVFAESFQQARRQLDFGWKAIVDEAERSSVKRFVFARQAEDQMAGITFVSTAISEAVRAAICLLDSRTVAPPWLTDATIRRISALGFLNDIKFSYLVIELADRSKTQQHKAQIARELLENLHKWRAVENQDLALKGLEELAAAEGISRRRDWLVGFSPQKRRPLRELFVTELDQEQATLPKRLEAKLLALAEWRADPLPDLLQKVPAVTEACIKSNKLERDDVQLGTLTPIEDGQLDPCLLEDADIKEALAGNGSKLFGSPRDLNLRWRHEGAIVKTLDNAGFVFQGDRLVVRNYTAPADEEQCDRILKVFETNATVNATYEGDRALPVFERYQKHRDTIRNTLLKELVSKVGYEKHHILRELLQNAESAYASKRELPADSSFEFMVVATKEPGWRQVVARHFGRSFNESDNEGKERHDVDRIWKMAAENERTHDEVGRFNRGFKTVFTVARDGVVRIQSGDYDFQVIDLLLLRPAQPKPDASRHSTATEFSFEVSYPDSLGLFRLSQVPKPNDPLPVANPSTFVFLRHLKHVKVGFEHHSWEWHIDPKPETGGWSRVCIKQGERSETFLVYLGEETSPQSNGGSRRFGAAVRLGANGLPQPLEPSWRTFRLTFETEHTFPLDFIINGDFEADQGRVGLRNISRSGLVERAYEGVLARAQQEIKATPNKGVWLSWAKVLHLKDAPSVLVETLKDDAQRFRGLLDQTKEAFVNNVPHGGGLTPAVQLQFPSQLLRRLGPLFAQAWGIPMGLWIDHEIDQALPDIPVSRITLHGWLNAIAPQAAVLHTVARDLQSSQFAQLKLSALEQSELREARQVLAEKLRPVAPPLPPEVIVPPVDPWSVENLWSWWNRPEQAGNPRTRRTKAISDYILEGDANWSLLYPGVDLAPGQRQDRLRTDLRSETPAGKETWYRLLGLACLMSAGRRMSELRDFWRDELDGRDFWTDTCKDAFGAGTDALFDDLVSRRFTNVNASGEDAHFWRRVFYDIRKIHKLVWEFNFPSTILQLIETGRGRELPGFLRSGKLNNQQTWVGVFGQSAGVPLFFLIRELSRLGIIPGPEIKPLAFFVATPVRRAAERIGWIPAELAARVDFQSLAEVSERLYNKIHGDPRYGPPLLADYDIPLLHLGLNP